MIRKLARENAFILLFEKAMKKDENCTEIFEKALEVRNFEFDDYVKKVFFGVEENQEAIDKVVEECLVGWNKNRISNVSIALLNLATYEMIFMDDIPTKVSINEAIELSKKYDDEKTFGFVNGVLNAIAEKLGKK